MGFALAEALTEQGAEVCLITGPVNLEVHHTNINRIDVNTADEMFAQCVKVFPECVGAILAAAVADYRPEEVSPLKIKKTEGSDSLTLKLVKNKDILAELGKLKTDSQILGGFSLETHNELDFAAEKMKKKNCDFIIMNSMNDEGAGFKKDTNKVTILSSKGQNLAISLKSKKEVAEDIVNFMITNYF